MTKSEQTSNNCVLLFRHNYDYVMTVQCKWVIFNLLCHKQLRNGNKSSPANAEYHAKRVRCTPVGSESSVASLIHTIGFKKIQWHPYLLTCVFTSHKKKEMFRNNIGDLSQKGHGSLFLGVESLDNHQPATVPLLYFCRLL